MNVQKVQQFLRARWQFLAVYGAIFGALGLLQFVLLGSLLQGFNAHEVLTYQKSVSLHQIWQQPLGAPFHLVVYALLKLMPNSLFATRLAAAGIGFITLVLFFVLLRAWYGERTALLGTILFGTSSWFLHTTRSGTTTVLYFGLLFLVAAVVWARRTSRPAAWLACIVLATAALYVPGIVWFLLAGALWQIRTFGGLAWQRRWVSLVGGAVAILGLAPLAWRLYSTPSLIKPWLGLPSHWVGLTTILRSIAAVPVHIFLRNTSVPDRWLGNLPILDIFSIAMLLFGIIALLQHSSRLAIGFGLLSILSCVLIGIGVVDTSVLIPFVYVVITGGLNDLLERWSRVFPRNPIARNFSIGLLALAIAVAGTYNIRSYFIAWPQASVTEAAFTYHKP